MNDIPRAGRARTLSEDAYQFIRAEILSCRLVPGSKLKINVFCERLDVSLGAVREALSKLSSEGLVLAEAQRGFRVAPVSRDELIDLTQTRIEIECLCLAQAIQNGDIAWESHIVASFHSLSRIEESQPGDNARLSEAWAQAHGEFHTALVAACQSPVKLRIRKSLYEQTERYRRLSFPTGLGRRDLNMEHKAIMDAALARKPERACEAMNQHLRLTADILLSASFTT